MLAFLTSVLAEIIAGLAVWKITEGPNRSGGQQTIMIERAFFIDSSPVTWVPSTRRGSSSEEADPVTVLMILGAIVVMVVAALVGIAALYVQHINLILATSFWVTIGLAVLGGLLLILGLFHHAKHQDWSVAQIALYSLVLCAAFGGLVWLIYSPPNAPPEYDEVFRMLENLDLQAENWKSDAFDIGWNNWPVVQFLLLQAIGILPMFVSMIALLYVQIRVVRTLVEGKRKSLSVYAMVGAPVIAFIASILLGLLG